MHRPPLPPLTVLIAFSACGLLGCDGAISVRGTVAALPQTSSASASSVLLDTTPPPGPSGKPIAGATVMVFYGGAYSGQPVPLSVDGVPWSGAVVTADDGSFTYQAVCSPYRFNAAIRVTAPGFKPATLTFPHNDGQRGVHEAHILLAPEATAADAR